MVTSSPAGQGQGRRHLVTRLVAAVALLTLILAAIVFVDGPAARWVHDQGIDAAFRRKGTWTRTLSEIMKTPGETYFAIVIGLAIIAKELRNVRAVWLTPKLNPDHALNRLLVLRSVVFFTLAALASSSNTVVKWIAGRQRPFHSGAFHPSPWTFSPFRGGPLGLFTQANLSFPSGHSCQAFAVATALIILYPRWGWLALFPAIMTACERVLSNSHYLSEVLAGGALGAAGAWLVAAGLTRFLPKPPADPPAALHDTHAKF